MIICIFGKSGSGKSYLANKLNKDLKNSIHIDLDILNKDLMRTPKVINDASKIFEEYNVITNGKLDTQAILKAIILDGKLYNKWTNYMIEACNNFLRNYINSTNYDYYILDHLNASKLEVCNNDTIYIRCELDKKERLARLNKREQITEEILDFRDEKYIEQNANLVYTSNNYKDILNKIIG